MENFKNSANLSGLTVKNGRLINDRPNMGIAGVTAACIARKELKKANKIEMYAEAVAMGNRRSEMSEGPEYVKIIR
jgi:hypothetical protein